MKLKPSTIIIIVGFIMTISALYFAEDLLLGMSFIGVAIGLVVFGIGVLMKIVKWIPKKE